MNLRITIFTALFLLFYTSKLSAQISAGGTPISFSEEFQSKYSDQKLETTIVPVFDLKRVKAEDRAMVGTVRFSAPIQVDYSLESIGTWTVLENGDRIWRAKLQSKNALGIFVFYEDFYLPGGAKFFMYNEDRTQVFGAYTSRNNSEERKIFDRNGGW